MPKEYLKVTSRLSRGYLALQDFALRLPQVWGAAEAGYLKKAERRRGCG